MKAVQCGGPTPPSPETELRPLTTHTAQDKATGGGSRFPGLCFVKAAMTTLGSSCRPPNTELHRDSSTPQKMPKTPKKKSNEPES